MHLVGPKEREALSACVYAAIRKTHPNPGGVEYEPYSSGEETDSGPTLE